MAPLIDQLDTIEALQRLIDAKVRESEVLEFKAAVTPFTDREKNEIAKDISGMANSLGGTIIYGVASDPNDKTLPQQIEPIDVRNIETIDRVINATIRPPIDGIRRRLLPDMQPRVLILEIPESQNPPHQSLADKKYYRRSGAECLPMEHDLIALKFGRMLHPVLDLTVEPLGVPGAFQGNPERTAPAAVRLSVKNLGRRVGRDLIVVVRFPPKEIVQLRPTSGHGQNIDRLHHGRQARQYGGTQHVYHPGMLTSIAELEFSFVRGAEAELGGTPLIEWTLFADEMEPRSGEVSLERLGWTIPQ